MGFSNVLRTCVVGLLGLMSSAHAADRVLIMTIADYEQAPLPGTRIDQLSAREIIKLLEVSPDHVRALSDRQLDAASIKQAFAQLAEETRSGDRVFVFFSGHGTSRLIDGRCQQALVAQDMRTVNPADINAALNAIKDKASKVVMMVDACHSGGVVGSVGDGLSRGASGLRAKFVAPKNLADQCSKPVNLVEERVQSMRSTGGAALKNNYLYIAAAQSNEVAFDDPQQGGVATSALLACLKSGAADRDRSGSVSFRELVQCAQVKVDERIKGFASMKPHHLQMSGNPDMSTVSRALPSGNSAADPVATLRDLQRGADSRWQVRLSAEPPRAKIGKETFKLTVSSSETGYLTLLYVGSDGSEFMQLYPQAPGTVVQISANAPMRLPDEYAAHGPAGVNHLLAIVSATPRDFSGVLGQQGTARASLANAGALQENARSLKQNPGSALYGAALLELVETN